MDAVYRAARRAGDQRFSMEPHNVRRRDRVPGLPAALVIAFAGSTSIAWAQTAPVVPAPPAGTQTPAVPQTTYTVTVVETAPLPGVELPLEKIPAPVQTATDRDITASGALDLSDFLNRRLNGVHVNEVQGNPFQADINYRGYTASPLLGTPQGLSVYMDGVRLNQPFGEVMSWDLFPAIAIASTTMMPGSNPLFGLNTLGGALSIQTKSGQSTPGHDRGGDLRQRRAPGLRVRARRPARERAALVSRRQPLRRGRLARRLAVGGLSVLRQARLAARHARRRPDRRACGQLAERATGFRNRAFSRATTRASTRSRTSPTIARRSSISRRAAPSTAARRCPATPTTAISAPTRSTVTSTRTRSTRPSTSRAAAEQAALAAAGYTGFPTSGANATNTPFPYWRCIGNVLLNDEPAEKCNGLINRTRTRAGQRRCRGTAHAGATAPTAGAISSRSAPPTTGAASALDSRRSSDT